jgi:hypothetical protein
VTPTFSGAANEKLIALWAKIARVAGLPINTVVQELGPDINELVAEAQNDFECRAHPMQPLEVYNGRVRFKPNGLVGYLVDWCAAKNRSAGYGKIDADGPAPDLNELARMNFSKEDWMQLAQLLGYSVSGYGGLSYASEESIKRADEAAERLTK